MDKTALIKPFKVLLLQHLLIAFDRVQVLHGSRWGSSLHVKKKMECADKNRTESEINIALPPTDLITHVWGLFLSSLVKVILT